MDYPPTNRRWVDFDAPARLDVLRDDDRHEEAGSGFNRQCGDVMQIATDSYSDRPTLHDSYSLLETSRKGSS